MPFKGGAETWAALEGGHVMAAAEGAGWWPLVDAGKVRVLVHLDRGAQCPNCPTRRRSRSWAIPFVFDSPFGIAGPKGMDPAIVKKLHDAFKTAMSDPKAMEIQKRYDYATRYMNSEDYTRFVREQVDEQRQVHRQARASARKS